MAGWAAAITAVMTVISTLLGLAVKIKQQRKDSSDDTNVQAFRQKLANDNHDHGVDAGAADQHDRVLRALRGDTGIRTGDGAEEHY